MLKSLLWQRSGGYWMFYSGLVYFAIGMYCIFVNDFVPVWLAQVTWITVLTLPFAIPPLGRWLNMDVTWDRNMFDWFKKKDKKPSNVVPFPEPKSVPKMPEVESPKKDPVTFYRLGLTNNNRVSFNMGYSEITMNAEGCQQMIDQLAFFQSQLQKEDEEFN